MKYPPHQKPAILTKIFSDLVALTLAWIIAYYLRFFTFFPLDKGIPSAVLYIKLLPFMWVIWWLIFTILGFYQRSKTHRSAVLEAMDVVSSCIVASLCFISFTYFYEEYRYSRIILAMFFFIHPCLIISFRSFTRKIQRRLIHQQPLTLLAVFSPERRQEILSLAKATGEFTKIIEVEVSKSASTVDRIEPINEIISSNAVSTAIVGLNHGQLESHKSLLEYLAQQILDVRIFPDFSSLSFLHLDITQFQGQPLILLNQSGMDEVGRRQKRVFDILVSTFLIFLSLPLFIVLAILIRFSSKGPIIFRQERMGLDGKKFELLKFRSMPIDAEQKSGPIWATSTDQRATKVGQIMRKYSFDELPQLWNVLKGDMSLVGPRPERPVFVEKFRKEIPGYMLRHKAKSGMTGWAQVNGFRGDTSLEKRIEYDLYYIRNWSLPLDLRIILMTFGEVFFSKNAY